MDWLNESFTLGYMAGAVTAMIVVALLAIILK